MFHCCCFFSSLARSMYLSLFCFLLFLLCGLPRRQVFYSAGSLFSFPLFFLLTYRGSRFWLGLGVLFSVLSQSRREFCASNSRGRILGCTYTIWWNNQISIFCQDSQWIPFLTVVAPERVSNENANTDIK